MPTIQRRIDAAKTPAEKRRIEDSGTRYLRLILEGKRTGNVNAREASRFLPGRGQDSFQAFVRDRSGNQRSFNLTAVDARSQLEIPIIKRKLRAHPEVFEKKAAEWARRYNETELDAEEMMDTLDVRRALLPKRPSERIDLYE